MVALSFLVGFLCGCGFMVGLQDWAWHGDPKDPEV